ncbi:MAG TPA: Stp1/IreP family PP2C-type Ser/Thr phosphatase [Bryobacteraceae bacterium]|nr:Stp1/IreP family PP2C-type Ser/Thr phosphatase [Bryobacteraceae bacterium]
MKWFGATDTGRKRSNNEDAFQVEDSLNAAILADGMGGENCGEVGSALTVEAITEYLRNPEADLTMEEIAKEAIRSANRRVLETAGQRHECDGMGSTVVLVLWRPPDMVIANVGDSRAYLFRSHELKQLSYDQNFANELRHQLGLSEERVRTMPNRNVLTMAVGTYDHVLIRIHSFQLQTGDQILLCSDGLHGPVDHGTISQILDETASPKEKVERLIQCANLNGGPDNVTAVLLEWADG